MICDQHQALCYNNKQNTMLTTMLLNTNKEHVFGMKMIEL